MIESVVSYARHAVGNRDGGQAAATGESTAFYARHAVWNRDGGQAGATIESLITYARHAVGNRDGGQAGATKESLITYARHVVGNNGIHASCNQFISFSPDDSITIIAGIVLSVTAFHFNGGQAATTREYFKY